MAPAGVITPEVQAKIPMVIGSKMSVMSSAWGCFLFEIGFLLDEGDFNKLIDEPFEHFECTLSLISSDKNLHLSLLYTWIKIISLIHSSLLSHIMKDP